MVTVSSVDSFYMSKTPKIEKILNKITYYIYNIYIIYIVILIFYFYPCRQKNCQLKKLKTTYLRLSYSISGTNQTLVSEYGLARHKAEDGGNQREAGRDGQLF